MNVIWKVLIPIIPALLKLITPTIKDSMEQGVKDLAAKAKTTDNPWDDLLAAFLAGLFGIDLDK